MHCLRWCREMEGGGERREEQGREREGGGKEGEGEKGKVEGKWGERRE